MGSLKTSPLFEHVPPKIMSELERWYRLSSVFLFITLCVAIAGQVYSMWYIRSHPISPQPVPVETVSTVEDDAFYLKQQQIERDLHNELNEITAWQDQRLVVALCVGAICSCVPLAITLIQLRVEPDKSIECSGYADFEADITPFVQALHESGFLVTNMAIKRAGRADTLEEMSGFNFTCTLQWQPS